MKAGASLSTGTAAREAAVEAGMAARDALGGEPASLAVVFASPHHADRAAEVVEGVREAASPGRLIGCVGESVLGGDREVEGEPAVSVWLAALAQPVETFHMRFVRTGEGGLFGGYLWPDGVPPDRLHLLIADPFTFPVDLLLRHLSPGAVVMGGMASGGSGPGRTRLFLDDGVVGEGAVGAVLSGVRARTLVSQGCRPVGDSFTVTRAKGNVVHELGGRPPLERLRELFAGLPPADRELISQGVHVGRVIDEYKTELGPGDFLVRGVMGVDPESGALVVGDRVEVGETIRFHVRDAATADEELRALLDLEARRGRPAGGLLFTCNGRGSRLFGAPDHDASMVYRAFDGLPLAGFFCAGEIGPIGGRNFLHGFTASLALLEEDG
ncbi:MAG: FIST C-terminal domain-containing protein [Actinobacteria bacterium]|nr:FIST C-terminal domain-containing protein [Actinomycetota bacterium]